MENHLLRGRTLGSCTKIWRNSCIAKSYHNDSHEPGIFSPGGPGSGNQEQNGQGYHDDSKFEFYVIGFEHNDKELNGKPKEKEKVKLQQRHENLGKLVSILKYTVKS